MTRFSGFVQRTFKIQADETSLVLLSGLLFYTLVTCYNILKPIRDTMGLAGDAVGRGPSNCWDFWGSG